MSTTYGDREMTQKQTQKQTQIFAESITVSLILPRSYAIGLPLPLP